MFNFYSTSLLVQKLLLQILGSLPLALAEIAQCHAVPVAEVLQWSVQACVWSQLFRKLLVLTWSSCTMNVIHSIYFFTHVKTMKLQSKRVGNVLFVPTQACLGNVVGACTWEWDVLYYAKCIQYLCVPVTVAVVHGLQNSYHSLKFLLCRTCQVHACVQLCLEEYVLWSRCVEGQ